jgi:endonuclease/exonuclease/phosphatase family metal-dependent hydrolase
MGVRRRSAIRYAAWLVLVLALVAVWVLQASRPGTGAEGCAHRCATVGQRRDGPLRVLSLNMLHGFPQFAHLSPRLDLIAAEIRRHDPDIVCLQEVPWTRRLGSAAADLAQRTGLNHLYLRANGNRRAIFFEEGEAILSRYPLQDAVWVELQPRAGTFEHRVALGATAATPWGDLRVFVTHLTNGDAEVNHQQAASLLAFVQASASGAAVVAGDFNATEGSPQIRALTGHWVDAYRAANPQADGPTCCVDDLQAGPDEPLEKRIDYLFVVAPAGSGVTVHSARRAFEQPFPVADGWLWASDHVGLLVELALQP